MADLYPDAPDTEAGFSFDNGVIKAAVRRIYERKFNPMTEIDAGLFNTVWDTLNIATDTGYGKREPTDPDFDFYQALRHNNAVFSAFKVHRAQNDMAKLLLDSNGRLKSFEQWSKDVKPIASHQFDNWLRTEYDTAVLRARLAAEWKQFEREADVLPNLRWIPSVSIHPGADHRIFWNTVRPIDDPFWSQHRPGDRWNCKCGLANTDDPVTDIPYIPSDDKPSPGLDNQPEKDAKLFNDTHPYIKHAYKGAEKAVDKLMKRINEMIAEMPDNLTADEKMAIAKNNLEIEKALGITKGKPMTVEQADKQNANPKYTDMYIPDPNGVYYDKITGKRLSINPLFDRSYNENCQTCAPAYALRLKGFDITAKGNTSGSKLEYLSKGRAFEVWNNLDGTPAQHVSINDWLVIKGYQKMTPKRYMEFFNEVCKDEGVYELSIGWKRGSGHATILQRFKNGELRYIEPQHDNSKGSGQEWKDVKYLCENGAANSHSCRGIMKIDNKLFNIDFIDIFDK